MFPRSGRSRGHKHALREKATEGGDVWDGVSADWKVRSLPVTGEREVVRCTFAQGHPERLKSQSIPSKTLAGQPGRVPSLCDTKALRDLQCVTDLRISVCCDIFRPKVLPAG